MERIGNAAAGPRFAAPRAVVRNALWRGALSGSAACPRAISLERAIDLLNVSGLW